MLYTDNHEGYTDYNIDQTAWRDPKPGLSAMLRLANEEEWIKPAVESIIDWHDEIICTLQCSKDNTESILRSFNSPKIKIYHYPFKSWPNGPGHDKQIKNSVHNNAYFYNWSLSLTTRQWVSKWDGDMVAHDWLGSRIHAIINEDKYYLIYLCGINIVHDLIHKSATQPIIAEVEPRFFLIKPTIYYTTGDASEELRYPPEMRTKANIYYVTGNNTQKLHRNPKGRSQWIEEPSYLHFKWAKNYASAHMAWPENWEQMPRFVKLNERANPGEKYNGPIPKPLKGIMG